MHRFLLTLLALAAGALAQDAPLESVGLEGSHLSKEFVLDIAGLQIGANVNPGSIEAASVRLRDSGIFESISYEWAPGPNHGYAMTLTVQDQSNLLDASIDIPGVNEDAAWQWLAARYPQFDHLVPKNDAAENFLVKKLEEHFAAQLGGQKLTAKMESDLSQTPPRMMVSFQPEQLTRVESIVFTGQKEFGQDELTALLQNTAQERGYTERSFRQTAQLNLRQAYEAHGMYRMHVGKIEAVKGKESGLAVTVSIDEGARYTLGKVEMAGAGPMAQAMYKAGGFELGKVANWTEIQSGISETEKPLKRQGYYEAAAKPEQVFHDEEKVMDLRLSYTLGPIYHFGKLQVNGLTPALEGQVRQIWQMKPGDPFNYDYPHDFTIAFYKVVDGRQFNRIAAKRQPGAGEHVMDIILSFEMKQR